MATEAEATREARAKVRKTFFLFWHGIKTFNIY
jgi:hypothetical protein